MIYHARPHQSDYRDLTNVIDKQIELTRGRINECKQAITAYTNTRKTAIERIKVLAGFYISNIDKLNFESLTKLEDVRLNFRYEFVRDVPENQRKIQLLRYLNILIDANRAIRKFNGRMAKEKERLYGRKEYFHAMKDYFMFMSTEVCFGYKLHFRFGFLECRLAYDREFAKNWKGIRTFPMKAHVNWAISMANKKKLIEEGKVPYAAVRGLDKEVLSDNGGEKWAVMTKPERVTYIKFCHKNALHFGTKFVRVAYTRRFLVKFREVQKEYPEVVDKFNSFYKERDPKV